MAVVAFSSECPVHPVPAVLCPCVCLSLLHSFITLHQVKCLEPCKDSITILIPDHVEYPLIFNSMDLYISQKSPEIHYKHKYHSSESIRDISK